VTGLLVINTERPVSRQRDPDAGMCSIRPPSRGNSSWNCGIGHDRGREMAFAGRFVNHRHIYDLGLDARI
jgi:hypothetical protein